MNFHTSAFLTFTQRLLYCHNAATADACEPQAAMSLAFGRFLGLPAETLQEFYLASYLHDIGYLAIPSSIINRTSTLDRRELEVISQHPVHGEWICRPLEALAPILPYIRSHHEKINGEGYPDGLHHDQIALSIQQFQMADIYIALTSKRPHRHPLSKQAAMRMIEKEVERNWRSVAVATSFLQFIQQA